MPGLAQVEAEDSAAEQAGRRGRCLANFASAVARRLLAFGQRDGLARLETQVPAPSADPGRRRQLRLQRRRVGEDALELPARALAPGPITSGRSGILSTGTRSRTTPSASISASRCWSCHRAAGVRSTMSMTNVSGSRRETRASLTQPNCSSRSRIAGDVDQRLGGLGLARNRCRAAQLVDHHRVDQLAVHLLEADDLIAVDPEARAADGLAGLERRLGGNVESDRCSAGHQHEKTGETERGELVRPSAAERRLAGSLRRRTCAFSFPTRAASALPSAYPFLLPSASSTKRSTSSP